MKAASHSILLTLTAATLSLSLCISATADIQVISPAHASRARGPSVTLTWKVEGQASGLRLQLDDGAKMPLRATDRTKTLTRLSTGVHKIVLTALIGRKKCSASSVFYVYNYPQQPSANLYTLDLTQLRQFNSADHEACTKAFDTLHAAAVLQGLVNRNRARLYVFYNSVDRFWLDKIREKGAYLEKAKLVPLDDFEAAVAVFRNYIKGVVVWDPNVPATSNLASTICGVESLLPVRYDESPASLYSRLVRGRPRLPIARNLVGLFSGSGTIPGTSIPSTGSAKCDAYLWAKINYIDTGKCNPRKLGYWCDGFWLKHPRDMSLSDVGLTNHDYIVANKGFICDLNVWPDEAARDDPDQKPGTDRSTFQQILASCYKKAKGQTIHIAGFTPWAIKYTNHGSAGGKHGPVDTEWKTVQLVSAYNAYLDADAIGYVSLANASVFSLCRLPDRLVQNPPPTREELIRKGYILADGKVAPLNFIYHYLGDYDSAAWLYNMLPTMWNDPNRGTVAAGWAFNPNLIERMPPAFAWCYETRSAQDYFVAGDNGAGYLNPTQLIPPTRESGLPPGDSEWVNHNLHYFRKLNYSITGFVINGFSGELTDQSNGIYTPFSGDGIMTTRFWLPPENKQSHLLGKMVVAEMNGDIVGSVHDAVKRIAADGCPHTTRFLAYRSILKTPEWIKAVNRELVEMRPECRFEPVDPYTFFYLLRLHLGSNNDSRATYTFDTMPDLLKPGEKREVIIGLRNDGWDMWKATGRDAVAVYAGFNGRSNGVFARLPHEVPPGGAAVVKLSLNTPKERGQKRFTVELCRGMSNWFGDKGDTPWEKTVTIR